MYVTGDTHGLSDIGRVVNFFADESEKQILTKKDYLIILGDVGVCWDNGENDDSVKMVLKELPVSTLWIDGNHENFDILSEYNEITWNGGKVQEIEPDIIHLMRGQVYQIEGKTFFTFGGAFSTDRSSRVEGVNWWPEEMPSKDEYKQGLNALKIHDFKVDFILTHTAPYDVVAELGVEMLDEEKQFQQYLQRIADNTDFQEWFFGHYHENIEIDNGFHGVMDDIIRLL